MLRIATLFGVILTNLKTAVVAGMRSAAVGSRCNCEALPADLMPLQSVKSGDSAAL